MDIWPVAIVLGIVEGLTEFIPVSSTGHLIMVGSLLGFEGKKAATFEVVIQLGAVLSVVVLYWKRFLGMSPHKENSTPRSELALMGWSGLWRISVATVPALIAGYLGNDFIKAYLFTPTTVAWALAVGGIGMLFAERFARGGGRHPLDLLTVRQAFGIGLFQTLSLWPGMSRSAATIAGGLLLGLDRKGAAEFSFLIAVPIMVAATGYDMLRMRGVLTSEDLLQLAVGFFVSFSVGLASIVTFIRILNRWSLVPFAWYRIVAAPVLYLLTRGLNS